MDLDITEIFWRLKGSFTEQLCIPACTFGKEEKQNQKKHEIFFLFFDSFTSLFTRFDNTSMSIGSIGGLCGYSAGHRSMDTSASLASGARSRYRASTSS